MTGPLDQSAQKLVNAAAIVEAANSYLAFFNSEVERAGAMISDVHSGFAELHEGLAKVKGTSHELMQLSAQVAATIANRGVQLASEYPPWS